MMGLPDGWVCDVPINRNAQLKALGNGVVPQQAEAALRWLLGGQAVREAGGGELLGTPTAHERTHTPRAVDHGRQLANQVALLPTHRVNATRSTIEDSFGTTPQRKEATPHE